MLLTFILGNLVNLTKYVQQAYQFSSRVVSGRTAAVADRTVAIVSRTCSVIVVVCRGKLTVLALGFHSEAPWVAALTLAVQQEVPA